MNVRTRYAPSPTGYLHIGGLRTALYSYLFAKKHGGDFLLRIEDTDQERLVAGGIEHMVHSLEWAGLVPDEGVLLGEHGQIVQKGSAGPYIQSERLQIYRTHVSALIEAGHAYYCFCAKERLAELRKAQESARQPTLYDGHCRDIGADDAKKRAAAGEASVVRMKMPREGVTAFHDLVRGDVEFRNELIDDQVILKSDGFPTYHLAVVVDDHCMGISHVIRGEDWISSTPKHLQLYNMFGWDAPAFAHLSLLLNSDKSKLSKRQGDVAVEEYREKGYLPEALVNFVAFLGWNPGGEQELFTLSELVEAFDLEHVNKAGAVCTIEKLNWYNERYIRSMPLRQLTERCLPFLKNAKAIRETGYTKWETDGPWLDKVVALEKDRMVTLSDLPEAVRFVFELPEYDRSMLTWKKSTTEDAFLTLEHLSKKLAGMNQAAWNTANLQTEILGWIEEEGYSKGDVLWPMRVALSGQEHSPGPFEIADVLGKEETMRRVHTAITKRSS